MTLQVRVSRRAERDADAIFDWLAGRSPDGAIRWYEAYLATVRSLVDCAPGCPMAAEADRLGLDLRQVMFRTRKGRAYRLLFLIRGGDVHIMCVRGPGQDLASPDDPDLPQ